MGLTSRLPEIAVALEARVRAAEIEAAKLIEAGAKSRVPVDPDARTHLRDAIHTEEREDGVYVVAGDRRHWWGHILEHGSVKMAARPFLIPSLEDHRAEAIRLVEEAVRRA